MKRPRRTTWHPGILFAGIGLILIAIVAVVLLGMPKDTRETVSVRAGDETYKLWVANTDESLAKGLSGVPSLRSDQGLFMEFPSEDDWGIWMKDMEVPLDIIWVNAQFEIVHVVESVSPEIGTTQTFRAPVSSKYVLELSSGSAARAAIQIGQTIKVETGEGQ